MQITMLFVSMYSRVINRAYAPRRTFRSTLLASPCHNTLCCHGMWDNN